MDSLGYPTTSTFDSKLSAADGVSWTAFAAMANQRFVRVHNSSAVAIDVRRGGAGSAVTIPAGQTRTFFGVDDAAKLSFRRNDTAVAQVTVGAEGCA